MSKLRIIVTGLVGLTPVGGVAWDYLQYVVGLSRLGHDVYYYENTRQWPYHPVEERLTDIPDYSVQFIGSFFQAYAPELAEKWFYCHLVNQEFGLTESEMAQEAIDEDLYISPLSNQYFGMSPRAFDEIAASADLYINVSGTGVIPCALSDKCVKVFLDTDPGYNQIILSEKPSWSKHVDQWSEQFYSYDMHFTYAENIHAEDCLVPKIAVDWHTTRMPIVMDLWNCDSAPPSGAPWSTIMTWSAFNGALIYQGKEYRSKDSEFERIIDLPKSAKVPLLVALGGKDAPQEKLVAKGWLVRDAPSETRSPEQYQRFIQESCGEVSTAKNVYVAMKSGWFSCRTACYLAAGRPAVVQDTGFSNIYPSGEGLLTFETLDQASAALDNVHADYSRHAKASKSIAQEYFESNVVLTDFLQKIGVS